MESNIYEDMFRDQQQHWWFVARRKILRSVIQQISLKSETQICEAGCGVGGNLAMLSEFGNVHAFEINVSAIEKSRSISNADIREGALPDRIPFPADQLFDLIVSFDVLEHIEQDSASMKALIEHLKPGGHLFVTVPAHAWLMSAHDLAHHHHRRYSKKSLLALTAGNDVSVLRCGYFNSLLFPLIALTRLVSRGHQGKSDAQMPRPVINAMLTRTFGIESWLTKYCFFPFGTSLGLLIKKNY